MIILMEEYTLIKLQLYFFIFLLVKTTIILDYIFFTKSNSVIVPSPEVH